MAQRMNPKIHEAISDIQIEGKAGHSSIEHLILIKTWMLNMEVNNGSGIFQGFDMDFFCIVCNGGHLRQRLPHVV